MDGNSRLRGLASGRRCDALHGALAARARRLRRQTGRWGVVGRAVWQERAWVRALRGGVLDLGFLARAVAAMERRLAAAGAGR